MSRHLKVCKKKIQRSYFFDIGINGFVFYSFIQKGLIIGRHHMCLACSLELKNLRHWQHSSILINSKFNSENNNTKKHHFIELERWNFPFCLFVVEISSSFIFSNSWNLLKLFSWNIRKFRFYMLNCTYPIYHVRLPREIPHSREAPCFHVPNYPLCQIRYDHLLIFSSKIPD